jgi:hypothetical protein
MKKPLLPIEMQTRNRYLDAYRKYQASYNYSEFNIISYEKNKIDDFIKVLRDKTWNNSTVVPAQLRYFAGEISFAASGLVDKII